MRAVYFNNGNVDLREIGATTDEGKRVHVRSIGICGSDLHMLEMRFPDKFIAGHEIGGVLDDGTPVAIEPIVPCEECEFCQNGNYNICPDVDVLGISRNGGMADEIIVPERCLTYLPSNLDVKDTCFVEPLAVAVHGLRKAGINSNQRVAVIGGGTIGLCAVAVARACHAEVGLDARHSQQIMAGHRLGATRLEGMYDLVIECTGTERAIKNSMGLCQSGGKFLVFGTYWTGVDFPQLLAMMKEITVINSYMYAESEGTRDFDIAAALLSRNPEIASSIITHRFPLDEAKQAFDAARDRKSGAIKVVLEP